MKSKIPEFREIKEKNKIHIKLSNASKINGQYDMVKSISNNLVIQSIQ